MSASILHRTTKNEQSSSKRKNDLRAVERSNVSIELKVVLFTDRVSIELHYLFDTIERSSTLKTFPHSTEILVFREQTGLFPEHFDLSRISQGS